MKDELAKKQGITCESGIANKETSPAKKVEQERKIIEEAKGKIRKKDS